MDQKRFFFAAVAVIAVVGSACGDVPPTFDGGLPRTIADAGSRDAGAVDAGTPFAWADAGPIDPYWVFGGDGGVDYGDGGCQVTMCLTGAPSRGGSNAPFDAICDNAVVPGVISSCDALKCHNTFNTFLVDSKTALYPKLFAALDTNGDNLVNSNDTQCRINILGYSWGGISAVQVASQLAIDNRIEQGRRRIFRLFVMDAYQPGNTLLVVPTNVDRFIEYRHSVSPTNDCSRGGIAGAAGGPFEGIQPRCYMGQTCLDYDYSLAPTTSFVGASGTSYTGNQIGHCDVPDVAAMAVLSDFRAMPYSNLPAPSQVLTP